MQVIFTGDWSMPVREAEAANALVDAGCDVITCHVDGPKVVIETAEKRGVKSCGHNASQAPLAPKGFITGAEYKWETIYKGYAARPRGGQDAAELHRRRLRGRFRAEHAVRRRRSEEGKKAAIAAIEGLKAKQADLCRSAQGQQDRQGRDRQDLRQPRPVPRQDGLSARRRRRLDHLAPSACAPLAQGRARALLADGGDAQAPCLSRRPPHDGREIRIPLRMGLSGAGPPSAARHGKLRPCPTARRRRRSDSGARARASRRRRRRLHAAAAHEFGICRHPAVRADRRRARLRRLPARDRQVAASTSSPMSGAAASAPRSRCRTRCSARRR